MADFYLLPSTGFSLAQWLDPARPPATLAPSDPGEPSRLNARLQAPHTRWRCTVGTACTVQAIPDGDGDGEAEVDGELGGRLFSAWWVEWPDLVTIATDPGVSAVLQFTPAAVGHHLLAVSRPGGGIALCHFDAEAP